MSQSRISEMRELFAKGEAVRVHLEPACPKEFSAHGIPPFLNGLLGVVEGVEPTRSDRHYYRVGFYNEFPDHPYIHMWFTPNELANA